MEFIPIIILSVLVAAFIAYNLIAAKRTLHMLQLNMYFSSRYLKWYFKNLTKEFTPFYIVQKPEKKKFVVTPRVKRIYITLSVLLTLVGAVPITLNLLGFNLASYIAFACALILGEVRALYVCTANTINIPIEAMYNNYYLNDAKKILNQNPNLIKIGITGSFGKTSTKYILSAILSQKFHLLMTPESYNTLMGVCKTIRSSLKRTHEVFVCEMGANQTRDIEDLCKLVKPTYGVLTSIGLQHLETFGSPQNIINTKYDLVKWVNKSSGTSFLNFENDIISEKKSQGNYISYGLDPSFDYYAKDISYDSKGVKFTFCGKDGENFFVSAPLLGMHNVINIVSAISVALHFGVSEKQIVTALKQIKPVPHRLELKNTNPNYTVIDDAFNSNPNGAKEALNVLSKFDGYKKILITPGFVELGEKEDHENYLFGCRATKVCDFIIVVGRSRSAPFTKAFDELAFPSDRFYVASDLNDALLKLNQLTEQKSVVLFENDLPDNY